MKKLLLIHVLFMSCLIVSGQNMLSYSFRNNLNETGGIGPALTVLGNEGYYVTDTMNEINNYTRTVYRFENNSGLQLNNSLTGNFIGETYSIELYFVFDELSSWKRVVDWKNRTTDYGAYVYYGQLNFYPYVYSQEAPVAEGQYTYYIVTRDGATKEVLIYTDAKEEIRFVDSYNDAIIDSSHVLNFFQDDLVVQNEASSGAVALINIYNYVLDTNAIKDKWKNLNHQIFGTGEKVKTLKALAFPNPASDKMNIDLRQMRKGNCSAELISSTGKIVYSEEFSPGIISSIDLNTNGISPGLYLLVVRTGDETFSQKVIVRQ